MMMNFILVNPHEYVSVFYEKKMYILNLYMQSIDWIK